MKKQLWLLLLIPLLAFAKEGSSYTREDLAKEYQANRVEWREYREKFENEEVGPSDEEEDKVRKRGREKVLEKRALMKEAPKSEAEEAELIKKVVELELGLKQTIEKERLEIRFRGVKKKQELFERDAYRKFITKEIELERKRRTLEPVKDAKRKRESLQGRANRVRKRMEESDLDQEDIRKKIMKEKGLDQEAQKPRK